MLDYHARPFVLDLPPRPTVLDPLLLIYILDPPWLTLCSRSTTVTDVLKESVTIGVPLIEDTVFTIETVTIEYEWKPPRRDLLMMDSKPYEPKATTSAPKKRATKLGNTSKSSSTKNQTPKATITSTKEGKI
ncbi:hypothetical protein Tco_1290501 [Tanacetum coccineum]